jgi:hypothetical protein
MYVRAVQDTPETGEDAESLEAAAGRPGPRLSGIGEQVRAWRALLGRPLTPYYLIVGITTLLLTLGLVMVLSTASVTDLSFGLSPYSDFEKQLAGVVIGLPLMWIAARSSPRLFRAAAYPLLAVAIIGLGLILIHGVGQSQNGATRWIALGPLQFQPSELAKLALAVWGADLLARKEKLGMLADWHHLLVPLMPGTGLLALLVMAGDDVGTTFVLLIVFLALLWFAGTPGRVFTALLILMGMVLLLLVGLAARVDQRLHLRDHRGGTRPGRHALRHRDVRRAGVRRPAGGAPRPRLIQQALLGRHHLVDRDPGGGEHRRGGRRGPDHRRAAPAGVQGLVIRARDDGRTRYAHVVCAAGTRRQRGAGRSRPRRGIPRSKLAWHQGAPR